jgi:hypothetical protein
MLLFPLSFVNQGFVHQLQKLMMEMVTRPPLRIAEPFGGGIHKGALDARGSIWKG